MTDLTDFGREQISSARLVGASVTIGANNVGVPRATSSVNEGKIEKNGVVLKFGTVIVGSVLSDILKVPAGGGVRGTRILKRDRRATLPHIAADFNDGASTSVSVRTVQRTVINMGSQSRRPTRVPLLTARRKALLLSWARQHYHWTVDDWKHVTWSDESRFQLYRTDARVRVWRQHH
ncbi:hypothetical protein AVEN_255281-1 [Araneus ventricosus]|uniref:Transposase Tc1-like domain-containing protein n=1 Tax=Araneus ventricosus TaxID=182803 RepID=A0A4Y2BDF6_ARAVE|nr:hypothetical protein AVEN_255281-1 [Araneus ventricosus]